MFLSEINDYIFKLIIWMLLRQILHTTKVHNIPLGFDNYNQSTSALFPKTLYRFWPSKSPTKVVWTLSM